MCYLLCQTLELEVYGRFAALVYLVYKQDTPTSCLRFTLSIYMDNQCALNLFHPQHHNHTKLSAPDPACVAIQRLFDDRNSIFMHDSLKRSEAFRQTGMRNAQKVRVFTGSVRRSRSNDVYKNTVALLLPNG